MKSVLKVFGAQIAAWLIYLLSVSIVPIALEHAFSAKDTAPLFFSLSALACMLLAFIVIGRVMMKLASPYQWPAVIIFLVTFCLLDFVVNMQQGASLISIVVRLIIYSLPLVLTVRAAGRGATQQVA